MPGTTGPRTLRLEGGLSVRQMAAMPQLHFQGVKLASGDATLSADGIWGDGKFPAKPTLLTVSNVDRALLGEVWDLLALQDELPQVADIQQGLIAAGQMQLLPMIDAEGRRLV